MSSIFLPEIFSGNANSICVLWRQMPGLIPLPSWGKITCAVFRCSLFAYCSTADLHQMLSTTEFIGARAFLFHTDRREDGHLYGDVLMMDLDTLRQDYKTKYPLPLRRQYRTQRWFSGYGQPERMDWNGALRKRCSEKLGIFLCPKLSYGMAVPLFHDVQTVDGSGISLYAPGFRGTPEYAIYGGSPVPGYGKVPHTTGNGKADASL